MSEASAAPQSNADIVRSVYEALNHGDLPGALARLDPDVTWDFTAAPDGAVYRGHEDMRRFFGMLTGVWDAMRIEVVAQEERGDTVITDVRVLVRGRGSSAEVQQDETHIWHVRDGKLVEGTTYLERAKIPKQWRSGAT